jgi:threonine dehydratase
MWPLLRDWVDDSIVVSLDEAARAMKLVADRVHVVAEGAAACAVAAAVSPAMAARGHRKIVAVVSGGNIDLSRFAALVGACGQ